MTTPQLRPCLRKLLYQACQLTGAVLVALTSALLVGLVFAAMLLPAVLLVQLFL